MNGFSYSKKILALHTLAASVIVQNGNKKTVNFTVTWEEREREEHTSVSRTFLHSPATYVTQLIKRDFLLFFAIIIKDLYKRGRLSGEEDNDHVIIIIIFGRVALNPCNSFEQFFFLQKI